MNSTSSHRFILGILLLATPLTSSGTSITKITDQVFQTHHSSNPSSFINLTESKVLFMATPSGTGERVPFVTDGSTAGTQGLLPSLPVGTYAYGDFHLLGQHAYFITSKPGDTFGKLWKTDGTQTGTLLITDQAPNEITSVEIVNGRIVGIVANHPEYYLWASDGTPAGTGPIFTPPPNASISSCGAANGAYYVSLTVESETGRKDAIWKSNGTTTGTLILKSLEHIVDGTTNFDQSPSHATAFNGSIYFLASETVRDPSYGDYYYRSALWKSDGTPSGTHRVGNFAALYHRMYAFRGSLYLEKNGGVDWAGSVTNPQILRSNGTIEGSSSIFTGTYPRTYTSMQRVGEHNGHIYYNAWYYNIMYPTRPKYSDLHRMLPDGTFEGLGTLPASWNYTTGDQLSHAYPLANRPGGFYFGTYGGVEDVWKVTNGTPHTIERLGAGAVASNATIDTHMIGAGNNFASGVELFSSQGGRKLIADLSPGVESTDASYSGFQGGPRATLGNLLLYNGQDPVSGTELWRSDGTPEGTFRLKDISTNSSSSAISAIYPAEGFAWFIALRGDISPAYSVAELWKTDGTPEGTNFIRRCPESESWINYFTDNSRIMVKKLSADSTIYSYEVLDGPGAGQVILPGSGQLSPSIMSGGEVWWQEIEGFTRLLKRSDGTDSPAQIVPLPTGHILSTLEVAYDDGVICTTIAGNSTYLVWIKSTGSVLLHTREGAATYTAFRKHNGLLYFLEGNSLYASDVGGNPAVLLHSAAQFGNGSGDRFVSHRGDLYFISRDTYDGPRTLWKTRGTPATTSVTPVTLPSGFSDVTMISNGDWLIYSFEYYDANLGNYVQEARFSSGTADGEPISGMSMADLGFYAYHQYLSPLPSREVFFNRYTPESGDELYKLVLPAAQPTTPFGIWAQSHGLNASSTLASDDSDWDGMPNMFEYYVGTHPNQPASNVKPVVVPSPSSGSSERAISIPRMPGTGLTLVVESSVDLKTWNPDITISPEGAHRYADHHRFQIQSRSGSAPEIITFSLNQTAYPKAFARFRVKE